MKKIVVQCSTQTAYLYENGKIVCEYTVSTAKNGLGCQKNSNCTPFGKLRIAKKIGESSPVGTVFRARVSSGQCWSKDETNPLCKTDEDLVLTRILWLEGCEPHNLNTIDRYIYFHGTNQEHLLGQPVSHGCIRLSNKDIIDLFNRVEVGVEVEVIE